MSGGADIFFLSFFLPFSRQLQLVKRIAVKGRRGGGAVVAATAAAAKRRMQLCDASVDVESSRVESRGAAGGLWGREAGELERELDGFFAVNMARLTQVS